MKKVISTILAAAIGISLGMPAFAVSDKTDKIEIYVSPDGSDTNSGTKDKPLLSLSAAITALKKVRNEYNNIPVDVIFAGGEYRVINSVSIGEAVSGSKNAPVTFKSADGEKAIFNGSVKLDINDFTAVTDEDIYNRLPKSSRDRVGEMDLKKYGITSVGKLPGGQMGSTGSNSYLLYLDGERQTLARWPDVGYEKIAELVDKNNSIFRPAGTDITRWGTAKPSEIGLGGFLTSQYGFDRCYLSAIDAKERTIQIPYKISGSDRRFFLMNIVEELNSPGEWYINPETMKLYYYPEYKLSTEALELTALTSAMIKMKNASYINFENLSFREMSGSTIEYSGCSHININDCEFDEIGRIAVADTEATNMKYYYDKAVHSSDILIDSCIFTDIGSGGVVVTGGDYYTLTPANIKVTNSYFARYALDWKNYSPAIDITGVGVEVYNNTIHDSPGNGIQSYGNDHKIMYNEIYEILKDVHDAGGVYEGRSAIRRGTEFAYNYYHDLSMTDPTIGDMVCGLYMDDGLCEWNIHHNVFENCIKGLFLGGGDYSTVENNMFIDCPIGPHLGFYINENRKPYIEEAEVYKAKYPAYQKYHMDNMMQAITKGGTGNKINSNLLVNSLANVSDAAIANNNECNDNISVSTVEEAGFNDFKKQDYSLNPNSEAAKANPELLKIDMSKIGISDEMWARVNNSEMIKFMPANGSKGISAGKVTFRWQNENICDRYVFTVATDPEMKKVVYSETVRYNYVTLNNVLKSGKKVYYWNVYGIDSSMKNFEPVMTAGVPFRLETASYDELNKIPLNEEIEKASVISGELSVGNEMGQCSKEAIDEFTEAYNSAVKMQKTKYSTQSAVDECTNMISRAVEVVNAKRNIGFENLSPSLNNGVWRFDNGTSYVKDGKLTLTNGVAFLDETIPSYKLLAFKMKPDKNYDMIAITLRLKQLGVIWRGGAGGDGYTMIIKPELVEYQRYKNGRGGILKTCENLYLKADEWNDIEVGCVAYKDGIKTILRINGHDVLNEYDDSKIITAEGKLQFENFTADTVLEVASADTLPVFENSIVTGKLGKSEPILVNGTASLNKTRNNGVSVISGLNGNEIINADAVFNGQEIGLRCGDSEEYTIAVTDDKITLTRKTSAGKGSIANIKNTMLPMGEKVNITFGAYPCETGMRILLYKGSEKIIDYIDSYSKFRGSDIKIYENGKGSLFIEE